jgi:hypothetical protein
MIQKFLIAACLVLPVAAMAADEKKLTPQQQKMATCNKEAGEKKLAGDERKKFMSECLSAKGAGAEKKMTAQQQKMATCNKEAGDKKLAGDERKKFMSECLRG